MEHWLLPPRKTTARLGDDEGARFTFTPEVSRRPFVIKYVFSR